MYLYSLHYDDVGMDLTIQFASILIISYDDSLITKDKGQSPIQFDFEHSSYWKLRRLHDVSCIAKPGDYVFLQLILCRNVFSN